MPIKQHAPTVERRTDFTASSNDDDTWYVNAWTKDRHGTTRRRTIADNMEEEAAIKMADRLNKVADILAREVERNREFLTEDGELEI